MKKKKTPQKNAAAIPDHRTKSPVAKKRSDSIPRPALHGIGRSFEVLLNRTKLLVRPAGKTDT
jgi:hypothetical protein